MAFSSRPVGVIGGSLLLVLGLAVAARSCGTADATLSGVWHGYGALSEAGGDPTLARNIAAVRLTLRADGRFDLVDGGLPFSGRWRRRDDALTFEVERIMDRPLAQQPSAAQKAAEAFGAKVESNGRALAFQSLSGETVRLARDGS